MEITGFILLITICYLSYSNFKLKKQVEIMECYKRKYFEEQKLGDTYRTCLSIAIKDMLDNKWYTKESEAFYMLFSRIKPYRFLKTVNVTEAISRMLYFGNTIKFSPDLEQELLDKGE